MATWSKLGGDFNPGSDSSWMPPEQGWMQYDSAGRPIMPRYRGLGRSADLKDNMYFNRRGMGMIQSEAMRTGPSQWAKMQQGRQMDALGRAQAGQLAQQQNRIAMQGGLRGGASERMAGRSLRDRLMEEQRIRSGIETQDANRKWKAMMALPQVEIAESKMRMMPQQFNIQRRLAENQMLNQREMMEYREAMRAWAAKKTADAMPSGGGSEGLISDDIPLLGFL